MGRTGRLATTLAALGGLAAVTACGGGSSQAGQAGQANQAARRAVTHPAHARSRAAHPVKAFVKHAGFLTGVSCATARRCVAVGSYYYGAAGPRHTLVEWWNGTGWRAPALPAAIRNGTLTAVSCASASSCTAVGSPVLGWNGHQWRVELRSSSFDAVSCPKPNACVAVGVTPSGKALFGIWNGRSWRTGTAAAPTRAQTVTLAGVSCAAARDCMAVGDYSYGATARPSPAYRDRLLAERWNGSRWVIVPAVNVAHRDRFTAVTCTGPSDCLAVGSADAKNTLAERWNGASWLAERTPDFGRVGYSELTGVSCTASRCLAVGDYNLAVPFAEIRSAGRWALSKMPSPAGRQPVSDLVISCAAGHCDAAGTGAGKPLAAGWNGTSWLFQVTISPL